MWRSLAQRSNTASAQVVSAHALANALTTIDLEPDADSPNVPAIGPDPSGNLLEVIWLDFADIEVVIHAMALSPLFYDLLP